MSTVITLDQQPGSYGFEVEDGKGGISAVWINVFDMSHHLEGCGDPPPRDAVISAVREVARPAEFVRGLPEHILFRIGAMAGELWGEAGKDSGQSPSSLPNTESWPSRQELQTTS